MYSRVVVVAIHEIVEHGIGDSGRHVHASPGVFGVIVDVADDGAVTVLWDESGTACLVDLGGNARMVRAPGGGPELRQA